MSVSEVKADVNVLIRFYLVAKEMRMLTKQYSHISVCYNCIDSY